MGIVHRLRLRRRELSVLIVVPLVACALTFGLLVRRPPQYEGGVEFRAPSFADVDQYVANFEQYILLPVVVAGTAGRTGVSPADYQRNLRVERLGSANLLRVSYTSPRPEEPLDVATAATRLTAEELARPRIELALRALATADREYERARADIDDFFRRTGLLLPSEQYTARLQQVGQLRLQLENSEAGATAETVTDPQVLGQILRDREAELEATQRGVLDYQRLEDSLNEARAARSLASEQVIEARTELEQAQSPVLITALDTLPLPYEFAIARGVLIAGVLGLGLAIAAVRLLTRLPGRLGGPRTGEPSARAERPRPASVAAARRADGRPHQPEALSTGGHRAVRSVPDGRSPRSRPR